MDKFLKDLEKLEKGTKDMIEKENGSHNISDFLTDNFIRKYTKLNSLDEFLNLAGIETQKDFDTKTSELDEITKKYSSFSSFQKMLDTAAEQYMQKALDNAWKL